MEGRRDLGAASSVRDERFVILLRIVNGACSAESPGPAGSRNPGGPALAAGAADPAHPGEHGLLVGLEVTAHLRANALGIARPCRVDEFLVHVAAVRREGFWLADRVEHEPGVALGGVPERVQQPQIPLARCGADERTVKPAVWIPEVLGRHHVERLADQAGELVELGVGATSGGEGGELRLDGDPQSVDRAQVVGVQGGDDRAARRAEHDEALRLELAQRLADRDVADAELFGQCGDGEGLPGREVPVQDGTADLVEDEIDGRGLAFGHGAHPAAILERHAHPSPRRGGPDVDLEHSSAR